MTWVEPKERDLGKESHSSLRTLHRDKVPSTSPRVHLLVEGCRRCESGRVCSTRSERLEDEQTVHLTLGPWIVDMCPRHVMCKPQVLKVWVPDLSDRFNCLHLRYESSQFNDRVPVVKSSYGLWTRTVRVR